MASQPLDNNYKPISTNLYDASGAQFVSPQGGIVKTGSDNTLYAPQIFSPSDGYRATYGASIVKLAVATSANVIFTLTGSATKIIRVTRIELSGTCATTAKDINFFIAKYSTAATSGTTGTAPTIFPYDSASAAATATIAVYTADPTAGTSVGNICSGNLFMAVTGGTTATGLYTVEFGRRPSQAVVLRGTTQQIGISLNGENTATSVIDIAVEWTEESLT